MLLWDRNTKNLERFKLNFVCLYFYQQRTYNVLLHHPKWNPGVQWWYPKHKGINFNWCPFYLMQCTILSCGTWQKKRKISELKSELWMQDTSPYHVVLDHNLEWGDRAARCRVYNHWRHDEWYFNEKTVKIKQIQDDGKKKQPCGVVSLLVIHTACKTAAFRFYWLISTHQRFNRAQKCKATAERLALDHPGDWNERRQHVVVK